MVTDPRAALGAAALRSLNQPRRIEVRASKRGLPRALAQQRAWVQIERVQDIWRIDDEWWRALISRLYFLVYLENGVLRTIYHDLVTDSWYEQRY